MSNVGSVFIGYLFIVVVKNLRVNGGDTPPALGVRQILWCHCPFPDRKRLYKTLR
jgi:hypothetical protein